MTKERSPLYQSTDPVRESEEWIRRFPSDGSFDHVLFYGSGLGYHIRSFVSRFPNISFSIYEPGVDAMPHLLQVQDMSEWPLENLRGWEIEQDPSRVTTFIEQFLRRNGSGHVLLFSHPGYQRLYPQRDQAFKKKFHEINQLRAVNRNANARFQRQWTLNSMENLPLTFSTPNMLLEHRVTFGGKPVVLIAAGPSLEDEIENLKKN